MNFGLDSLVKNLSNNDLKHLSEEFSGDLSKLVKQKGVYPYEYTDSFKKIFKDKLFDKCNFFSSLNDECIGKKDYQRATYVWNMFKMNTISDYHDFYLKADVLSLADVFQKFISTCLHYYGLDSCQIVGSDIDIHLFIEKGIGGGIYYIAKRYDSDEESNCITYLDANNLYGWAMNQHLPYCEFKWLNQKEISRFCLNFIEKISSMGYILEVDLNFPDDLHELHNDYAVAL